MKLSVMNTASYPEKLLCEALGRYITSRTPAPLSTTAPFFDPLFLAPRDTRSHSELSQRLICSINPISTLSNAAPVAYPIQGPGNISSPGSMHFPLRKTAGAPLSIQTILGPPSTSWTCARSLAPLSMASRRTSIRARRRHTNIKIISARVAGIQIHKRHLSVIIITVIHPLSPIAIPPPLSTRDRLRSSRYISHFRPLISRMPTQHRPYPPLRPRRTLRVSPRARAVGRTRSS